MKRNLFILVVCLQAAWIVGTSIAIERQLAQGQVIRLETERVDPRELLKGDYLALNYKINSINPALFPPTELAGLSQGKRVWVALALKGDSWAAVRASSRELSARSGEVVMTGELQFQNRWKAGPQSWRVTYGIERFYIPEDSNIPLGSYSAEVVVPESGRPLVTKLFAGSKQIAP